MRGLLFLLGILPFTAMAQALKPFDRLSRDNVTLNAKQIAGGGSTSHNWESGYGSFDRDKTGRNTIEVEVSPVGAKKEPIQLVFTFVAKTFGGEGKEDYISDQFILPTGSGKAVFSAEASHNDQNYIYLGERIRSGKKLVGWYCSAIRNGVVVGIAGSSHKYYEYAMEGSSE